MKPEIATQPRLLGKSHTRLLCLGCCMMASVVSAETRFGSNLATA